MCVCVCVCVPVCVFVCVCVHAGVRVCVPCEDGGHEKVWFLQRPLLPLHHQSPAVRGLVTASSPRRDHLVLPDSALAQTNQALTQQGLSGEGGFSPAAHERHYICCSFHEP